MYFNRYLPREKFPRENQYKGTKLVIVGRVRLSLILIRAELKCWF